MEKITFDNGFRLLLEQDERAKSCAMGVWAASGSRFETSETLGLSHFIEHMVFKGTTTRSAFDIAALTDEFGGSLNAYTAKEYTCYYARALPEHVTAVFEVIGDMLTSPKLDDADIALEKGVVCEEISMYEDSPEDLCADALTGAVWRDDMLGRSILGTRETVGSFTRESLINHMGLMYVPERMTAAFCGKFSRDKVIDECEKFFGSMKNTGNPPEFSEAVYHPSTVCVRKSFEQNQLCLAYPGVSATDPRRHALNLLCSMLGSSSSSRLFQRLREELGLVYSVDSYAVMHINSGLIAISMGLSRDAEELAVRETMNIISSFASDVTHRELDRAKNQAKASLVMGLESVSAVTSRMGRNELLFGKVSSEDELITGIEGVTLDEIKEIARELFEPSRASICAVGKVGRKSLYCDLIKCIDNNGNG